MWTYSLLVCNGEILKSYSMLNNSVEDVITSNILCKTDDNLLIQQIYSKMSENRRHANDSITYLCKTDDKIFC